MKQLKSESLWSYVHLLYLKSIECDTLDNDTLVHFIKKLIESEQQPGGPYNDPVKMLATNSLIYLIAHRLNINLPGLNTYLSDQYFNQKKAEEELGAELHWLFEKVKEKLNINETERGPVKIGLGVLAKKIIDDAPKSFKVELQEILSVMAVKDKFGEINGISKKFYDSIENTEATLSQSVIDRLGEANILGWIAYTIYDDILDSKKNTNMVNIANYCHRRSFMTFMDIENTLKIEARLTLSSFNDIDISSYKDFVASKVASPKLQERPLENDLLYKKSCGHILGPLIIMRHSSPKHFKTASIALGQYLKAKQIADDMKDWQKDLSNKQVNSVASYILLNFDSPQVQPQEMVNIFWESGFIECANTILQLLEESRRNLSQIGMTKNSPFISQLIHPLDEQIRLAISDHFEKKEFLSIYAKKLT